MYLAVDSLTQGEPRKLEVPHQAHASVSVPCVIEQTGKREGEGGDTVRQKDTVRAKQPSHSTAAESKEGNLRGQPCAMNSRLTKVWRGQVQCTDTCSLSHLLRTSERASANALRLGLLWQNP